jgi:uncharacterized protein with FMN-binding domain
MKKFFKWAGIVILALIVIIMIYAVIGKKEVLNVTIETINLEKVPDGTYVGSYDNYRWSNKVEVTVKEHKITDISTLKIQEGRNKLVEELTQKIIDLQSPDVEAISGATASSNGFLKAVEIALYNAANQDAQ